MKDNKKIALNIAVNILAFGITIAISLFITPLIVNHLGGEAYGFIGLANNFVSYAALITIALNSMASRFLSIEIYQNNYEEANKYFSSLFFSNLILAIIFAPILAVVVWKLQFLMEIPGNLLNDVKLTFAVTFLQFIFSILLSRFEIATFVTNKLYLTQKNNLISCAIRLLPILICFRVFSVKISFVALATFAGTLFGYIMNVIYTKRFIPDLKLRRKDCSIRHIKTLLSSGIWSLLSKLSSVLLDGLDLLLSNLFIGPVEMGALAISKTVPAMFTSLRGTLDFPFAPPMTQCYAKGDIDGVIMNARTGNKILGILMIAPMATFAVYGQSFFSLWVPGEDSRLIQILSLLAIMNLISGSCVNSAFTVFAVANKIMVPSLVMLGTGIITIILNFIFLSVTNWGVYVIAGVSSVCSLLRNYIFTPLYGAHCLGAKKSTFYHEIITGNICLFLNLAIGLGLYHISSGRSWVGLIFSAGVMAIICICVNFFVVLCKKERLGVYRAIRARLNKIKGGTK
jgi:O-antigen/teichoic acid export membrane protein